jgi:hypothetical protein
VFTAHFYQPPQSSTDLDGGRRSVLPGRSRALPPVLPPQNRTCDFHRIRLKQVTNTTFHSHTVNLLASEVAKRRVNVGARASALPLRTNAVEFFPVQEGLAADIA